MSEIDELAKEINEEAESTFIIARDYDNEVRAYIEGRDYDLVRTILRCLANNKRAEDIVVSAVTKYFILYPDKMEACLAIIRGSTKKLSF